MPDFSNIISVDLSEAQGFKVESHKAVHQWDSGVILQLTGVSLPSGSRAQFDTKTTTYNQDITSGECEIPNALLGYEMTGDIKCHVYVITENYGIVVYDIHIPVIRRPKPDSYIYTDNTSSENGWLKTDNGFKVNEGQSYLGRTTLKVDDNGALLTTSQLSLANQGTIINGNSISLASGAASLHAVDGLTLASGAGTLTQNQLSLASGATTLSSTSLSLDSSKATLSGTQLTLNTGRITIGPNKILADSRVFGSVNIADKNQVEQGTIVFDSGVKNTDVNRCRSGFIKVNPSISYSITIGSSVNIGIRAIVQYNSLQNFISTIQDENIPVTKVFTVGNTTEYIRLVFQNSSYTAITPSDITNLQLEEGTTASDYVPYCLDNVELTNRRYVQDWKSRNLADIKSVEVGTFSENIPTSNTHRLRLAKAIKVKAGTTYHGRMDRKSTSTVHFFVVSYFDSTDAKLSEEIFDGGSTTPTSSPLEITFTTPSSCEYVRFVFRRDVNNEDPTTDEITAIQIEEGLTATPYVPYALDNIDLTNRRFVQDLESKNLLDIRWFYLGAASSANGDYIGKNFGSSYYISTGAVAVSPNTVYTCSCDYAGLSSSLILGVRSVREAGSNMLITGYQNFENLSNVCTFTTGPSTYWINIVFGTGTQTTLALSNITYAQLEKSPSATPKVPYALGNIRLSEIVTGQSIAPLADIFGTKGGGNGAYTSITKRVNSGTAINFADFVKELVAYGVSSSGMVNLNLLTGGSYQIEAGQYYYHWIPNAARRYNENDNNGFLELFAMTRTIRDHYMMRIHPSDATSSAYPVISFYSRAGVRGMNANKNNTYVADCQVYCAFEHFGKVIVHGWFKTVNSSVALSSVLFNNFPTIAPDSMVYQLVAQTNLYLYVKNNSGAAQLIAGGHTGSTFAANTTYYFSFSYYTTDTRWYDPVA